MKTKKEWCPFKISVRGYMNSTGDPLAARKRHLMVSDEVRYTVTSSVRVVYLN